MSVITKLPKGYLPEPIRNGISRHYVMKRRRDTEEKVSTFGIVELVDYGKGLQIDYGGPKPVDLEFFMFTWEFYERIRLGE
jgi:hypothetical protein